MNILFVSIAFPPKNDPESLQAGRYYKGLCLNEKVDIEIVTSSLPTLFMPADPTMMDFESVQSKIIELKIPENKYVNYIIRKLNSSFLSRPDSKFLFHMQYRRVVEKANPPDIIYSRSYPLSSTIMAYKLKCHFNVPWFLHLSDPWSWSPLHSYTKNEKAWHKKWESECFSKADKIGLTSKMTIRKYCEEYPMFRDKFELCPNVMDDDHINKLAHQFASKLRIVYTGGLALERSAKPFLKALEELSFEIQGLSDKLEILFAGPMDRINKRVFEESRLQFVRHLGMLNFEEVKQLQVRSDMLLVIDNEIKDLSNAVFFPSKILDYLAAGKRIMAITTPNSCTEEILNNINSDVCYRSNIESIKSVIRKALDAHKKRDLAYFINVGSFDEFSLKENSKRLFQQFKGVI